MKKSILILLVLFVSQLSAQNLTLSDLQNICNKTNWEYANQYLINKNWEYYESTKGNSSKYNTITWSYNKSYGDKASAWFYIYTYEGFPSKITYSVFNKSSYLTIQKKIELRKYKLLSSKIEDDKIISTYENSKFILKITTEKREKDEDSSREKSLTAYKFLLIKKTGVFDLDNGNKVDYYSNGKIQAKYFLQEGKYNGTFTSYYYDGQIKKTGNYLTGIENGSFKEYYENGQVSFEYRTKEGVLNGPFKVYFENGETAKSGQNKNGKREGQFKEYDERGLLISEYTMKDDNLNGKVLTYAYDSDKKITLIEEGIYKKNKKDGIWYLSCIINDKEDRVIDLTTYVDGVKNGKFQLNQGDSLIFGSYKNDMLDGEYKIYRDFVQGIFGGYIKTDTTKINLMTEGFYSDGLKTGLWKNYYSGNNLSIKSKGNYLEDLKTGKWFHYYKYRLDRHGKHLPYSKELYLLTNYKKGKLNGKTIRFSSREKIKFLCGDLMQDTCSKNVYKKEYTESYYKNDKLDGNYLVKDTTGVVIFNGVFKQGIADGIWLLTDTVVDVNGEKERHFFKGLFKNGKREGKWIEYATTDSILFEYSYLNGDFDGDFYQYYNASKTYYQKLKYKRGVLKSCKLLNDSLTDLRRIIREYYINKDYDGNYSVKSINHTIRDNTIIYMQVYKMDSSVFSNDYNFDLFFQVHNGFLSSEGKIYPYGEFLYKWKIALFGEGSDSIASGFLNKDKKYGVWKNYYPLDDIRTEVEYINNTKGVTKYFVFNSNQLFNGKYSIEKKEINEIIKIKDGLRNGVTKILDKNNKVIRKEKYIKGILK